MCRAVRKKREQQAKKWRLDELWNKVPGGQESTDGEAKEDLGETVDVARLARIERVRRELEL